MGIATLWCTPHPNCASLGVQDGVNGDGLVLRARLVPDLRRDRSADIFAIPPPARIIDNMFSCRVL
jgi:hypothetical protein